MSVRYRTNYANEVHQLVVSVSRHLWVTKAGELRYQQKPFEVSLAAARESEKRHLVHYLVRDHHSGLFYAEVGVSPELPSVREFLRRAWSPKGRLSFRGLPSAITVPNTVADFFGNLLDWLAQIQVNVIPVTSGFQAGVCDLKTWEDRLRYAFQWYAADDLASLPALAESLCWDLNEEPRFRPERGNRWRAELRSLRSLPSDEIALDPVTAEQRRRIRDQHLAWLKSIAKRAGILE